MTLTLEIIGAPNPMPSVRQRKFRDSGGRIGRDEKNDWILPHGKVSRRHAVITFRDRTFYIEDRGTANGVFKNSTTNRLDPGRPHALQSGDCLFIDPYEIQVSIAEDADDRSLGDDLEDPFAVRPLASALPSSTASPDSFVSSDELAQEVDPLKFLGGAGPAPSARDAGFMDGTGSARRASPRSLDELDRAGEPMAAQYTAPQYTAPPPTLPPLEFESTVPTPPPTPRPAEGRSRFDPPTGYNPLFDSSAREPVVAPPPKRARVEKPIERSRVETPIERPRVETPKPTVPPPPVDDDPFAIAEVPEVFEPVAVVPPTPVSFATPPPLAPEAPPTPHPSPAAHPAALEPHDSAALIDQPPVDLPLDPFAPVDAAPPIAAAPPVAVAPPAPAVEPARAVRKTADATPSTVDLAAVLAGAGLQNFEVTPQFAENLGRIFREVVSGVMDVLEARRKIREEFRMRQTMFGRTDNNPLKFSANVDHALHNLFVDRNAAYLEPVAAFQDAFEDLRNHQLAMLAGLRVAFEAMLTEFDPTRLEEEFDRQFKRGALLSVPGKMKYWEAYRDKSEKLLKDVDATFTRWFGEQFVKAYEEQLVRLEAERRETPR